MKEQERINLYIQDIDQKIAETDSELENLREEIEYNKDRMKKLIIRSKEMTKTKQELIDFLESRK